MSDISTRLEGGHPPTAHQHGMAAIFLKMMGVAPFEGGEMPGGVTRILSGYSSAYLIPINSSGTEFCLIDSGMDPNAEEILSVLRYKGVDATALKAIFLTHGHPDHSAGVHKLSDAEVYVGSGDHDFIEGTGVADGLMLKLVGKRPDLAIKDPKKLHTIEDGEIVTVGTRQIQAFAIPGHTRGSMAYLIDDMLFVGDATTFGHNGEAQKPPLPVSLSVPQEIQSLAHLIQRFDKEQITVQTVIPSHSGTGTIEALRKLVG